MDASILSRIERLKVSIGDIVEPNVSRIPARVYESDNVCVVDQDFSGGDSEAKFSHSFHGLIAAIASLPDHLKKWGRQNGVNADSIDGFFKHSADFCIVLDLWNNDKHGYPPRDSGWSKKSPRVANIRRICELSTRPEEGSTVGIVMGKHGAAIPYGDGVARAVITGDVVDKYGAGLGNAHQIVEQALRVCGAALDKFGVTESK